MWNFNRYRYRERDYIIVFEKTHGEQIGWNLFEARSLLEWTTWTRKASLSRKVWTDIGHRRTSDRAREGNGDCRKVRERERSRCIDRRHKIHFMTWTLSSDWCISHRIASQIKRSSTLEPPLTTSPGSRRRRTMPSTLVCISHPAFSLFICRSHPFAIHVGRFIGKNSQARRFSFTVSYLPGFCQPLLIWSTVTRKELLDYLPASSMPIWRPICSRISVKQSIIRLHWICMCPRRVFLKTNGSFPPDRSEFVTMTFSRIIHGTFSLACLNNSPAAICIPDSLTYCYRH